MIQTAQPSDIVFPPIKYARLEKEYLFKKKTGGIVSVPWGYHDLDEVCNPMEAGDIIGIQGRPGNGKTAVMNAFSRTRCLKLAELHDPNSKKKRVGAYITGEQTVERLSAFHTAAMTRINTRDMKRGNISDSQWEKIDRTIDGKIDSHLFLFGYSDENRLKRPTMTISFILDALAYSEENYDIVFDFVALDYLQIFPLEKKWGDKTQDTIEFLLRCKQGAYQTGCPWIIGCQSAAEIDARKNKIPQMADVEWVRGAASQIFDGLYSVMRPKKYYEVGEVFGSGNWQCTDDLLMFANLKEKEGDTAVIPITLDPRYNHLDNAKTTVFDFRDKPSGRYIPSYEREEEE